MPLSLRGKPYSSIHIQTHQRETWWKLRWETQLILKDKCVYEDKIEGSRVIHGNFPLNIENSKYKIYSRVKSDAPRSLILLHSEDLTESILYGVSIDKFSPEYDKNSPALIISSGFSIPT